MIIDQEVTVSAPVERVWDFMLDIPSVARCVPGVQSVAPGEDGSWIGALRVKVGPIGATLEGRVRITQRDRETLTARMDVDAADKRLRSAVNARMSMRMEPKGADETRISMHTDASVLGKLGEFGGAVMKHKANQIVQEFARNVSRELSQPASAPASA